jgi:hypothetical protein
MKSRSKKYPNSFPLVDCVRTKKASGLYFVSVNDHGWVLLDLILKQLL